MKIVVSSNPEAHELLDYGNEFDAVISLCDFDGDTTFLHDNHITEICHDFDDPKRVGAPSVFTVERILKFTADLTDDANLLIHCWAGVSRSTAIALLVCVQHGMSVREAVDHVIENRPSIKSFWPNRLICAYGEELLGVKYLARDIVNHCNYNSLGM